MQCVWCLPDVECMCAKRSMNVNSTPTVFGLQNHYPGSQGTDEEYVYAACVCRIIRIPFPNSCAYAAVRAALVSTWHNMHQTIISLSLL